MKIAVNTRLLLTDRLEGIGRFTDEILKRVVAAMPEHDFTFLFDRPYDPQFIYADNVKGRVIFPQARHPILFKWWFDYSIPAFLLRHPHDLFLSTDGFMPLNGRIKKINVIHDINFEHFEAMVSEENEKYYKKYMPRFAHHADQLITVSEFSRFDIAKTYDVPEHRIEVVGNGVSAPFVTIDDVQKEQVRRQWTNGHPYFIYIGSMNKRKNIPLLLRAFDKYCTASGSDMRLLMVGAMSNSAAEIKQIHRSMTHAGRVTFVGRLSDDEMAPVLAAATALTFIPLFEGFGIPVIEAFACGVPVICTNVSSLPEVAQEAALYADPYSIDDIVGAMHEVTENETVRQRLISAGHERATHYTWDRSAEAMVAIIQKMLNG